MSVKQPFGATDKLTFLLSLVPFLIDHDSVSVSDVAAHFSVSPERVREAVRMIATSGVPGETKQYQHEDLFDIQWDEFETNDTIVLTNLVAIDEAPRFSAREAAALIAGLQYLSSVPDIAERDAISSLMAKLTRGSSSAPSQVAVARVTSAAALGIISEAGRTGVQVQFDYLNSRGELESRRVDPLRMESIDDSWYLRGWCHLREAVRTFRLDRMDRLELTSEPIAAPATGVILPEGLFDPGVDDLTVLLEGPASITSLLADYAPFNVSAATGVDQVRTSVRVAHFHGLKRLVTGLPGVVTVVEPADARAVVAAWAAAGAAQYAEEGS
jgi:proteasome accessory factor C